MLSAKPMMFAGLGVAAGVVAFIFLAPTFGGVVYGVSVNDPFAVTCAAVAVLLIVLCTTLSASREALRVNPASVLREE
jgi:ABC-type antimicrobial peptide transport system permease subunit